MHDISAEILRYLRPVERWKNRAKGMKAAAKTKARYEAELQSHAQDSSRVQLRAYSKQDILRLMILNKRQYIKDIQKHGKRMAGNMGDFDEQLVQKMQEDHLNRLINVIHQRQEDTLIFHLG